MIGNKHNWTIGGIGSVLVEVEERYVAGTGVKGYNGKEIEIDTRYEPLKYVKRYGKVIRTPFAMGEMPIHHFDLGSPSYGASRAHDSDDYNPCIYSNGVFSYIRLKDIDQIVNVGDTIWFQPLVLHRKENIIDEFERDGKKIYIFKVTYDLIICIEKKDGTPEMVGGWCLLEPIYQDWTKQLIPTSTGLKDANGNPILQPKEKWLQVTIEPPVEKMKGILRHFRKLEKFDFDYKEGAEVYLQKKVTNKNVLRSQFMYKGKMYLLFKQWDIIAEVIKDVV